MSAPLQLILYGLITCWIALAPEALLAETRVYAKGEGERINPAFEPSRSGVDHIELEALRGETVSFQIIVDTDDAPVSDVTVDIAPFLSVGHRFITANAFVEHFVDVRSRSKNDREPTSSLAWTAAARPSDDGVLGALPDALIPLELAACAPHTLRTFCPYPLQIPARSIGSVWVDIFVPEDQPSGLYTSRVFVRQGPTIIGSIDVALQTSDIALPYRPVSFFAYYAFDSLEERFDDPRDVEKQLWQLLHAHHIDAATALTKPEHADRVRGAYSADWFRKPSGYTGAGQSIAPAVSIIGAYGSLGEPTPDTIDRALAIAQKTVHDGDTFLYAVDEQCESPLGKAWKDALQGHDLDVGRTCGDDPSAQPTDLIMMAAQDFDVRRAARARSAGKKVFVYNGQLPFAGPLMLDAPLTSLTANGWIAATHDIGRWFLWETIFWNDDNHGGRGPRDVFADPETFHNADGDTCLLDGLLLYPGKQPRFRNHSLDTEAVLPSLRLKSLRRGIEDAGLLALAESADPEATQAIAHTIAGTAFDAASATEPAQFTLDPIALADARTALRRIIEAHPPANAALTPQQTTDAITSLRHQNAPPPRLIPKSLETAFVPLAVSLLLAFTTLATWLLSRTRGISSHEKRIP